MKEKQTLEEFKPEFESGLSITSLLASVYAAVVFIPAIIYLQLVTGQSGFPIAWFTLLLWVKLAPFTGKRLRTQEAVLVYLVSGAQFIPIFFVYNIWFLNSDIVKLFGFGKEIPYWFAPIEPEVFRMRTFLHPSWLIPMALFIATEVLSDILRITLGLFAREVYVEVEDLPFPMEQVGAQAITVVTGEEKRPVHILAACAAIGFAYSVVVYALPFIIQAYTGQMMQVVPIPWIDLNSEVQRVGLGGASLGIATDLIPYSLGLVLPFRVVVSMFIGSFAVYFFGNWLTTAYNLAPIPWWVPGMRIDLSAQRSIMFLWATILIGIGLAAGLGPLIRYPRILVEAITYIRKPFIKKRRSDAIPFLKWVLMPLILALAVFIALFALLVPAFFLANLWIFIPMIAMPFVSTLITGRMRGVTGTQYLPVTYLQNIFYLSSGYQKADIWVAYSPMTMSSGGWLAWLKTCQLTKTSAASLIKAYWIVWPISLFVGILYTQIFWNMAPIPSGRYPGAEIYWPIQATMTALWIRGREIGLFPLLWIVYSFAGGFGIYLIQDFLHLPISFASIAVGTGTLTPVALAYLTGGLIGVMGEKIGGKEWWQESKFLVSAGIAMGESVAISVGVGIALVINSIWLIPI